MLFRSKIEGERRKRRRKKEEKERMEAENDLGKKKKKKEENKKEKEYSVCVSDEPKNPSTISRTQAPLFLIFFI